MFYKQPYKIESKTFICIYQYAKKRHNNSKEIFALSKKVKWGR